jgi:hypothetical protein
LVRAVEIRRPGESPDSAVGAEGLSVTKRARDATTPEIRELFETVTTGSLVTAPPIEYHPDGTVTFSVFGPADQIQSALDGVPDPVSVTVEEISGLGALPQTVPAVLSDRQRAAIQAAPSVGYYEVPRTATHEDVADRLGCAPSTAAEHLRKAETTVIETVFSN